MYNYSIKKTEILFYTCKYMHYTQTATSSTSAEPKPPRPPPPSMESHTDHVHAPPEERGSYQESNTLVSNESL